MVIVSLDTNSTMKNVKCVVKKYLGISLVSSEGLEFIRYRFNNSNLAYYAAKEIRKKCDRHVSVSDNVIFVWNKYHTLDMEELD
tara:strand:- start:154 stop:405 length:252 start_codon:yes stop_codon:yes gene_type:complete